NAWDGDICVGEALCMGGQFERNKHAGRVGVGVLASHYGKGVGKGLMQEIERVAKENDISRLDLTVMSHNERAHRLYLSMGYKYEGINRHSLFVDGDWVDEIMMAKLLDE
ncbi:MAG: GNAT family N-acetyltransferase, partial [Pseudomonadota bacterium]|nr:GNAT family N-acetyltransferase [Pseudomonadota bacterium]